MINLTLIALISFAPIPDVTDIVDRRVSAAMESGMLEHVYREYVSDAQLDVGDTLSRYGAITAYCKMRSLTTYKLGNFQIGKDSKLVMRMADQAIATEPRKAFPLLANIYLLSNVPESLGPRTPNQATKQRYEWFTGTNPKTGETKRYRVLVMYFDDTDPRITSKMKDLSDKALRLEPENPMVLLTASQIEPSASGKLKHIRAAGKTEAKTKFPTTYLHCAYRAYVANKLDRDAALARVALTKRLENNREKMWAKLFLRQHREFATK